jgi:ATP-binding cassette, subfamily B, bacterial PglK
MYEKLNTILVKREKMKLGVVFVASICMSLLGTLGIAPIMPFIALAAQPEVILANENAQKVLQYLPFITTENILLYAGLLVIVFIIVSTSATLGFRWLSTRVSWGISNTMALRLLENYCYSPYEIFLTKDTKKMSFKILHEINTLTLGILMPLALLFSSIFTSAFLFILLLLVDYEISLMIMGSLGVTYVTIFLLFKKHITGLGKKRVGEASERFLAGEEILQNIKTTKVFGKEMFFLQKFSRASHKFTEAQSIAPIFMHSPKALIETITFGGIVAVIFFIDTQGGLTTYLPKLSLFALAGYRLLPALQQIYFSLTDIKYHLPGLDELYKDIMELPFESAKQSKEDIPPSSIKFENSIFVRDVTFTYPSSDTPLFKGLNLEIKKGERIAFIGSTGSGKSTLVDLIMGLLKPQVGGVFIDDHKLQKSDWTAWRNRVGYVPQEIFLINETIRKNIAFGLYSDEISEQNLKEAASIADIKDFIENELDDSYDTIAGERGIRLSGGQKQRIGLARALYHKPDVLVLDEATSALDNKTEKSIMRFIDKLPQDLTIIMVAHRLTTVKDCDVIYVLNQGEIVDKGSYDELKDRCKLFYEMQEPV